MWFGKPKGPAVSRDKAVPIESRFADFYQERARRAQRAANNFFWSTVLFILVGGFALWFVPAFLAAFDSNVLERERIYGKQDVHLGTQSKALQTLKRLVKEPARLRRLVMEKNSQIELFHGGRVSAIAVAQDGTMVSGGDDGTVRLWGADGKSKGGPLTGHRGSVSAVAIARDGSTIVSGGRDGTVRLWGADGSQRGAVLNAHGGWVNPDAVAPDGFQKGDVPSRRGRSVRAVAVAPDGTIVSGGEDGTVRLWGADGTAIGGPLIGHTGPVNAVAVAPDGTIVSGGDDGTIQLWGADGSQRGAVPTAHGGWVNPDAVAPEGFQTGDVPSRRSRSISAVAIARDGSTIVSGGEDGTVRLWGIDGTAKGDPLADHNNPVFAVAVLLDGTIVSGSYDGTVRLWRADGTRVAVLNAHGIWLSAMVVAPDGTIVSGSEDGTVRRWGADGRLMGTALSTGHRGVVSVFAVAPDDTIVSGGEDGTVRRWGADGSPKGTPLTGHRDWVNAVAVGPDGTIVSGSDDGTVRRWAADGTPKGAPLTGHRGSINAVAVAPDGTIVSGGSGGIVRRWGADGTPKGAPLTGHNASIRAIAVAPDGTIVSGGNDGTVRRWGADGTTKGAPLMNHRGSVTAVAIAPDGTIVSGVSDGTVWRWAADDTTKGAPLTGHRGPVNAVAVARDGTIVSGGSDGTVRRWGVDGSLLDVFQLDQLRRVVPFKDGRLLILMAQARVGFLTLKSALSLPPQLNMPAENFPKNSSDATYGGLSMHFDAFVAGLSKHLEKPHPESLLAEVKSKLDGISAVWKNAGTEIKTLQKQFPKLFDISEDPPPGGKGIKAGPWGDRTFITTQTTRFGLVILLLFLVQIFLSNYRYNSRIAAFYWARHNACLLADVYDLSVEELVRAGEGFSPDTLDFSRGGQGAGGPGQQLVQVFGRMSGSGR